MFEDVLIDGIYGGLLLLYHVHEVMDTFNLMKGAVIQCNVFFSSSWNVMRLNCLNRSRVMTSKCSQKIPAFVC